MRLRKSVTISVAIAASLFIAGCIEPPRVPTTWLDDSPVEVVIERINQNSQAMDFLLKGGVSAAGEYVDETGSSKRFDLGGTLLFSKPRNLYLKLEHTFDAKIVIGSNDEEFWLWEQIDKPRYSWGRHEFMDESIDADIPIRPDHLWGVLGLGELPNPIDGPENLLFQVHPNFYELIFFKQDSSGQPYISKIIKVQRRSPFLISSVTYLHPDGHPVMVAKLSKYAEVKGSTVLAPRHIHIDWPERKGWLELEFGTMKRFESKRAYSRFISPRQSGKELGYVERIDRPRLPSTSPALLPETQPGTAMER